MGRVYQLVFLLVGIVITLTGWIFAGLFYFKPSLSLGASQEVEYKDFISILLTALAVMIAILATTFAIAAVWGYAAVKASKAEAREAAQVEARSTADVVATRVARELAQQTLPGEAATGEDYGRAAGGQNDDDQRAPG
jgi:heme/copper-type cytochrome/quinol oxidase subunit 2